MNDVREIVVFKIRRGSDGLYTATSPDLSGVCVVHRDMARIIEDVPNIVRRWFERHRGMQVEPFLGPRQDHGDVTAFPVYAVPAEIAAQAMAR
jgi:hypothetical protein